MKTLNFGSVYIYPLSASGSRSLRQGLVKMQTGILIIMSYINIFDRYALPSNCTGYYTFIKWLRKQLNRTFAPSWQASPGVLCRLMPTALIGRHDTPGLFCYRGSNIPVLSPEKICNMCYITFFKLRIDLQLSVFKCSYLTNKCKKLMDAFLFT